MEKNVSFQYDFSQYSKFDEPNIQQHEIGPHCRNPTLAKCGGEAQHSQSWGFGVLRDSRMFRVRQKGPKHLALRCSWCH